MKTQVLIFVATLALAACNNSANNEQLLKIKDLAKADSLKIIQGIQKDSLLTSYLNDLNDIQENLDRIKEREKIITMKPSENNPGNKQSIVSEIKELDDWIVSNDKKMTGLEARLKRMDKKNIKLESLVAHLTKEITDKDEEIAAMQAKLSSADDSLKFITARFNDSIVVIKRQRTQMAVMNTVYYITGTMKQLQEKGVIDREGGFVGLGRVAELNPDANSTVFIKANLGNLKGISLHGKFRRFITTHPDKAYSVISNSKADSIAINTPATFWSESKFLVVAVK
ncbi:MAG TPA: hypothetical protein VK808_07735 [Bacteroidia bacterium]|nr:hypothetical protein [Bacteroidia bacterium]